MPRLALLLFLFSMAPPALAQNAGPFQVLRDPSGGLGHHEILVYEIDEALARDIGLAAAPPDAQRGRLQQVASSTLGYALGSALGYGTGLLVDAGADQLASGPGLIGLVICGSIGSALGAHLGSSPRGRVDLTVAGTLLAQVLVIGLATLPYDEPGLVIGPAIVASPFVAVGTSVGLERLFGGR